MPSGKNLRRKSLREKLRERESARSGWASEEKRDESDMLGSVGDNPQLMQFAHYLLHSKGKSPMNALHSVLPALQQAGQPVESENIPATVQEEDEEEEAPPPTA